MNAESRGPGTAVTQGIRDWGLGISRGRPAGGLSQFSSDENGTVPFSGPAVFQAPQPLNPSTPQPLSSNPQSLIPKSPRLAFTLIEILTVIVIIGLLVALVARAMGPVRAKVKVARMKMEITQLAIALERVRNELGGGDYPPDGSDLSTNSGGTPMDVQRRCRRAFPRTQFYDACGTSVTPPANGVGVPFPNIAPDTALVFWLGGIRDPSGAFIGFSADPTNPFDVVFQSKTLRTASSIPPINPSRIGPYYDFDKSRISQAAVPTLTSPAAGQQQTTPSSGNLNAFSVLDNIYAVYFPQNDLTITTAASTKFSPSPYLYFKAVAYKYSDTGHQRQDRQQRRGVPLLGSNQLRRHGGQYYAGEGRQECGHGHGVW